MNEVTELWCKNCGSIGSLESLRAKQPPALTCCPERDMLTLSQVWFQLPIAMRRRWWRETGFSRTAPSRQLVEAIKQHIEQGIR